MPPIPRRWWIGLFLGILALRAVHFAAGVYFEHRTHPAWSATGIWNRWDSLHYVSIGTEGYVSPNYDAERKDFLACFAPLLPFLIWLGTKLGIPAFIAGVTVSALAHAGAACLLVRLCLFEGLALGSALFAYALYAVYPASLFADSAYTDPLLCLGVLGYFYFLRVKPCWATAAVILAITVLARLPAVTLFPLHALYFWLRTDRRRARNWVGAAVPALGIVVYGLRSYLSYGDPLAFLTYGSQIPYRFTIGKFPYAPTVSVLFEWLTDPRRWRDTEFMTNLGISHLSIAIYTVALALEWRRLSWEYFAFGIPYLLLFASANWNISNIRYMQPLFPFFLTLARLRHPLGRGLLLLVFFLLLIYLTGRFTGGYWVA